MKTLVLFEQVPEDVRFFEVDDDWSRYNGVYINSVESDEKLQEELNNLVYDEHGHFRLVKLDVPTKDWDIFIKCGFLL